MVLPFSAEDRVLPAVSYVFLKVLNLRTQLLAFS